MTCDNCNAPLNFQEYQKSAFFGRRIPLCDTCFIILNPRSPEAIRLASKEPEPEEDQDATQLELIR